MKAIALTLALLSPTEDVPFYNKELIPSPKNKNHTLTLDEGCSAIIGFHIQDKVYNIVMCDKKSSSLNNSLEQQGEFISYNHGEYSKTLIENDDV